jgi:hypothetical protein
MIEHLWFAGVIMVTPAGRELPGNGKSALKAR